MNKLGCLLGAMLLVGACDSPSRGRGDGGGGGGGGGDLAGGGGNPDGGAVMSCLPDAPDQQGCGCDTVGATRSCYPSTAPAATRGVGACKDGMQTCQAAGEFAGYDTCTGATTPAAEDCTNGVDDSCDGTVDCADPTCATNGACSTGCNNGDTRPCYDGPANTLNVGTCKPGKQTCVGGMWPATCPGEVLPSAETCTDALDHNCNYLPGCLDFLACLTSPACQSTCDATKLDPMCVCPKGSGDTATCPDHLFGKNVGGTLTTPGMDECCPCTANDCGNAGCCAEAVCAGNPACGGVTCKPLPTSCNGMVNFDCDDFPEDCDEPCCKCSMCP